MKKILLGLMFFLPISVWSQIPTGREILIKMDQNTIAENRCATYTMVVRGRRRDRTMTIKSWVKGSEKSFSEYLAPAREKCTKMLKLRDQLWMYSPQSDRIIRIAGHMLRQSMMGSDFSYEDMMEERKLSEVYSAKIVSEENYENSSVWIMELISKVEGLAYYKRTLWIDKNKFVPLNENLYAKSGTLLKTTTFSNIKKIDSRWFPMKMNYKDIMKDGRGTDFVILDISFNAKIPDEYFSKNILKK